MSLKATKRIVAPLILLVIPLFGILFFKQVNWYAFDFLNHGKSPFNTWYRSASHR